MFNAFRRFLKGKVKKKEPDAPIVENNDLSKIGVELFNNYGKIQSSLEQTDEEYIKGSVKRFESEIQKGANMATFLVTLDTQNRPEVKDRALMGGLKNFYIVKATTSKLAKEMVLSTFAHKKGIVIQICHSLKATKIDNVISTITDQNPIWSYIPFRQNHKAPGQKLAPPTQAVNPSDSDEVFPMQDPPKISTPLSIDHTPAIKEANPPMMPAGMEGNPMAAMFGMMAQMMNNPEAMANMQNMMGGTQTPEAPKGPPEPPFKKVDPATDPELQERMNQNLASQGARHISHTGVGDAVVSVEHGGMDEMLDEAEAKAQAEIDTFKNLPKSNQTTAGSIVVKNDVSKDDMESFRKMQKRTGRNTEE